MCSFGCEAAVSGLWIQLCAMWPGWQCAGGTVAAEPGQARHGGTASGIMLKFSWHVVVVVVLVVVVVVQSCVLVVVVQSCVLPTQLTRWLPNLAARGGGSPQSGGNGVVLVGLHKADGVRVSSPPSS